ncbi:DUF6527 family protein [Streptomyces flaveolus]|uniref:DUF6527 family protein n=1 Tax=Streptomyces flaveolus TaxID=67297 RepID=UPI0036FBC8B1
MDHSNGRAIATAAGAQGAAKPSLAGRGGVPAAATRVRAPLRGPCGASCGTPARATGVPLRGDGLAVAAPQHRASSGCCTYRSRTAHAATCAVAAAGTRSVPPSPAQWSLTYDVKSVSLTPSVGNWALRCQAHCCIRQGKIHWSRRYSATEIAEICHRDHRQLDKAESRTTPGWLGTCPRGRSPPVVCPSRPARPVPPHPGGLPPRDTPGRPLARRIVIGGISAWFAR